MKRNIPHDEVISNFTLIVIVNPFVSFQALGLKNGNQALYYDAKKESIEMEEIGADEKA